MGKSVAFYTLGCKVNQYETEAIIQQFSKKGYEIRSFNEKADVYVINTCSVTSLADSKSRAQIRKARKQNPGSVIAVCGCYSQTHPEAVSKIKEADIIIGSSGKENIVNYVEEKTDEKFFNVNDIMQTRIFEDSFVTSHGDKTRAFMKIQDGCDNYCAYCIIPYARGHIRSRSMESIKKEAESFVRHGYKEIVLTGIHLTSYGRETKDRSILDVLLMLHEIKGLERIRLGSLEFNDDLIRVAKSAERLPKLCNHFHVSLQSGCNDTLSRMGRRYTTEEFYEGIGLLRSAFPGCAITTDIMVGFPGETEKEFADSAEFAKKAAFSKMHIFPYSIREGTRAAAMDGQIDPAVKKQRAASLEKIDKENVAEFSRSQVGTTTNVLFEQPSGECYTGHTTNYLLIYVKSDKDISKEIHSVKITEYKNGKLYGEICK